MAARKSCTHLTWAEAKGLPTGSKKKSVNTVKREDHGRLLAAKIISKNGRSETEIIADRQAARRARKDEQRAAQLQAQRELEKQELQRQAVVKPFEQAQAKLSETAQTIKTAKLETTKQQIQVDGSNLKDIAECKQMQLDEMLALEAIYACDADVFLISDACRLEDLRLAVEEWQGDEENEQLLSSIVQHPPISFTLSLIVEDPSNVSDETTLVALVVLKVTFVPEYPFQGATPTFELAYFMLVDKEAVVSANKPLESLGFVEDESEFLQALVHEAQQLLSDPCVYELTNWLTEHLFDYVAMHPVLSTL